MGKHFFKVAGHIFSVEICDELLSQMDNYTPFAVNPVDNPIFSLTVQNEQAPRYTEETRQEEENQSIICGKTDDGLAVFDFFLYGKSTGILICSKDFKQANLYLNQDGIFAKEQTDIHSENWQHTRFALNNSLMVLYSLATATLGTVLFHAVGIKYNGRGYLFLGKSGTGKSTHARLWLKYNEGSELFNDDNPVVRLFKNENGTIHAKTYGTPWSGKTPCYKNVEMELGGFTLLSQAPFNKISPLKKISAYAALKTSISGMRWDKNIADGLHQTENGLAANIPVWYLECLPDGGAAKLCRETIVSNE